MSIIPHSGWLCLNLGHNLEIERGRYTRLKLNVDQRLCMSSNVIEDEKHFLLHWQDNWVERELFVSVFKHYI